MHWPASLKAAARTGGELASLRWRRRRKLPMPWLALVDVSGSMERYARLLLAFLHQASSPQRYPQLRRHVYSVGSSLRDLNSAFALSDPDAMLLRASSDIDDFGGGTRLGNVWLSCGGKRAPPRGAAHAGAAHQRRAGHGEPQQLEQELQWIRRHSARLVWLNPLLRFEGYAPWPKGWCVASSQRCHAGRAQPGVAAAAGDSSGAAAADTGGQSWISLTQTSMRQVCFSEVKLLLEPDLRKPC